MSINPSSQAQGNEVSVAPAQNSQARWSNELQTLPYKANLNLPNEDYEMKTLPKIPQDNSPYEEPAVLVKPTAVDPNVRTTQYGWKGDNPGDNLTNVQHLGNRNNPLTPDVVALSDPEAKALNAQPGDVLQIGGKLVYYGDRAPENDRRVDLYQPGGMNKDIPDFQAIKNLGGGSSTLRGPALAQAGEANVQRFQNQIAPSVMTTPPTPAPPRLEANGPLLSVANQSSDNSQVAPVTQTQTPGSLTPNDRIGLLTLLSGLNSGVKAAIPNPTIGSIAIPK